MIKMCLGCLLLLCNFNLHYFLQEQVIGKYSSVVIGVTLAKNILGGLGKEDL